ncbi:MAG: NAD(+) kinase [Treponema sp.]|nr:MAG: NAD(+) kinase [Treponema sp.]
MKRVLIVISTYKSQSDELAKDISAFLAKRGYSSDVFPYDDKKQVFDLKDSYSFAVSLGGDGTVLFTARFCAPRSIPVFPVNLGQFGFIANISPEDWQSEIEKFLSGIYDSHNRMLLDASVIRNGENMCRFEALNDVVVSGSGIAKLVNTEIHYNSVSFGVYKSDGVIISTPTGSTAYSAASGGPILDPNLSAFVLTPISAFSLSNRPVVLPASGELRVKVLPYRQKNIVLSVDGQELVKLQEGDEVVVSESKNMVTLIGCTPVAFYNALRSKLGWAGSFTVDRGCKDA